MKYTLTALILTLLLSPVVSFAQPATIENLGFVTNPIWYSTEPFFAGKSVRVYTVLANSSEYDFSGTVAFYSNGKEIGSSRASLTREGDVQIVWIDWTPSFGNHSVVAKIAEGFVSLPGGEEQDISVEGWESSVSERFVDVDTDGDGVGNKEDTDDDNDGILDSQDSDPLKANESRIEKKFGGVVKNVEKTITDAVPSVASSVLEPVVQFVEEFRENSKEKIYSKKDKLAQEIEEKKHVDESSDSVEKDEPSSSFFGRMQLAALGTTGFILNNQFIFYPLLFFVGGYLFLYKGGMWLFRRFGSRDSF
jgi:hypothetical protein|tara:strand:- start:16257 stop:17177 length:921 start_codon:yes stop_codon:yes gene_type:complete